jgi:hypothetical protein
VADVDLHALARLAVVTRLRSPGIRRLLDRLTTAGLLTSVESHADRGGARTPCGFLCALGEVSSAVRGDGVALGRGALAFGRGTGSGDS